MSEFNNTAINRAAEDLFERHVERLRERRQLMAEAFFSSSIFVVRTPPEYTASLKAEDAP